MLSLEYHTLMITLFPDDVVLVRLLDRLASYGGALSGGGGALL